MSLTETTPRSLYYHLFIAAAAGVVMTLAFAPFRLPYLAMLSAALLAYLWVSTQPKRSFWIGMGFGFGLFSSGVSWIVISMVQFGGVPFPLAILLTVLLILIFSLYIGLCGYLVASTWRIPLNLRLLIIFPTLWILIEWFRGWFLTGFSWLDVGYAYPETILGHYAPLVGVYGVGWLSLFFSGAIIVLWKAKWLAKGVVASSMAILVALPNFFPTDKWLIEDGEPVSVSLVQGNIDQDKKWLPEQREPTLHLYEELSAPLWAKSTLVIWPETAIPAFYDELQDNYLADLGEVAKVNGALLLTGIAFMDFDKGVYTNAVAAIGGPTLDEHNFYHKRHLVPFGEYMPIEPILGKLMDFLQIPMSDFAPGSTEQALIRKDHLTMSVSVCYELAFGAELRRDLPQSNVLINVSNNAWFGDSLAPHQLLQMAQMRALEFGRYLVLSTNNGVSAVVNERGKIVSTMQQFKTGAMSAQVKPFSGVTPYTRFGDLAWAVWVIPLLLMSLLFRRTS